MARPCFYDRSSSNTKGHAHSLIAVLHEENFQNALMLSIQLIQPSCYSSVQHFECYAVTCDL